MNIWKIKYKDKGVDKVTTIFYKIDAVAKYINIMKDRDKTLDVSELKILKNDQDYTGTLIRFLYE